MSIPSAPHKLPYPQQNTGFLWAATEMKVKVLVKSKSLWPQGLYSSPDSSVHGILQARILEWVAFPFSRRSSWPRDQTLVSYIAGRFFAIWATKEASSIYEEFHEMKRMMQR